MTIINSSSNSNSNSNGNSISVDPICPHPNMQLCDRPPFRDFKVTVFTFLRIFLRFFEECMV